MLCAALCCAVQDGNLRHTVYYPTPAALEARVKLAEQLGAGLSIWELGQGMDSFLDLL
jgi:chitinase domain-containing protein 1